MNFSDPKKKVKIHFLWLFVTWLALECCRENYLNCHTMKKIKYLILLVKRMQLLNIPVNHSAYRLVQNAFSSLLVNSRNITFGANKAHDMVCKSTVILSRTSCIYSKYLYKYILFSQKLSLLGLRDQVHLKIMIWRKAYNCK